MAYTIRCVSAKDRLLLSVSPPLPLSDIAKVGSFDAELGEEAKHIMFNEREEKNRQGPQAAEQKALSNHSHAPKPHILVYINKLLLYCSIITST